MATSNSNFPDWFIQNIVDTSGGLGAYLIRTSGGGGGGGGNVNLTQIGSVAVGVGNPLYVAPGTGAIFGVTLPTTAGAASSFIQTWDGATFPTNSPTNITQYGGVAIGATNGFYVRPGTSAIFPVSVGTGGQATMSASLPVTLASDQSTLTVGGVTTLVTGTFTRPADTTTYAANDAVSNSTSSTTPISIASASRVSAGTGIVVTAQLVKSTTGVTGATFRLWLFVASPTSLANDNAAFTFSNSDKDRRIGYVDFLTPIAGTDCVDYYGVLSTGVNMPFKLSSGTTMYGLLQALGAYAPGNAEVFQVRLGILQD